MKVKLSDIIEALEFTDDMTHYFLDKTTGEIVMVSEFGMDSAEQQEAYDRLDEHGFYRLPEQYELNGYRTMEEFIETLPSPARDRLEIAQNIAVHYRNSMKKDMIWNQICPL